MALAPLDLCLAFGLHLWRRQNAHSKPPVDSSVFAAIGPDRTRSNHVGVRAAFDVYEQTFPAQIGGRSGIAIEVMPPPGRRGLDRRRAKAGVNFVVDVPVHLVGIDNHDAVKANTIGKRLAGTHKPQCLRQCRLPLGERAKRGLSVPPSGISVKPAPCRRAISPESSGGML